MKLSVRFLQDVDQLEVCGKTIGPFEAGEKTELWRWDAEVFEENGLVEVEQLSSTELKKKILAEERSDGLQQLPPNFYEHTRHLLKILLKKGDIEGAKSISSLLRIFLTHRVMKLLKLALSPEEAPNLPPEEKFLVNQLSIILESWINKLVEISAGEEVTKGGSEEKSV